MLSILLFYFIGKQFYVLAEKYKQNKWLYAILSIVVYYAGGFILTLPIMLLDIFVFEWGYDWEASYGVNLLVIPLGLLSVWGFYYILKNRWKKSLVMVKDEIQDIGKPYDGDITI